MQKASVIPAIEGGEPIRSDFLPFSKPSLDEAEKQELLDTLDSGWVSTGPKVKRFEEAMAQYIGCRHAVAVSSCTEGLFLSLVALGIGPGDEVITTPFTFPATINVILHCGAIPVLADIDPSTFNVSVDKMAEKITPRTKALLPVHYGGQPCDMDAITNLAESNGLVVIEDAATAIGAKYRGRMIGAGTSRSTVYSFYANKVMTTGEGGLVATDDDGLAERVSMLRLHGMSRDAWKRYSKKGAWMFNVSMPGYKSNMTDMQAALGLHQLEKLDGFIARREVICAMYAEGMKSCSGIRFQTVAPEVRSSRYLFPILVDDTVLSIDREQVLNALKAENIGTSVHYIPAYAHSGLAETLNLKEDDFPATSAVFDSLISLPLFPAMTDSDVQDVIGAVDRITRYYRR